MAERNSKIDWNNLPPLASRRKAENNIEQHGDIKFHRERAHHLGRNHVKNYVRRIEKTKKKVAKLDKKVIAYKQAMRDYWAGLSDCVPKKL